MKEMRKMKTIEGFYDAKRVGKVKRDQMRIARAEGLVKPEAWVVDAHAFYMKNPGSKSKLAGKRRPVPGDMMVVIFYNEVKEVVKKGKKVKTVVSKVVEQVVDAVVAKEAVEKEGARELRSMFAPLMPVRTEKRKGNSVSPAVIFEMAGKVDTRSAAKMSIPLGDDRLSLALAA